MIVMETRNGAQVQSQDTIGRSKEGWRRDQPASPEASKNRCRRPAVASRWCGHQRKTMIFCERKFGDDRLFNVETVKYKNLSFTVWDVGGPHLANAMTAS